MSALILGQRDAVLTPRLALCDLRGGGLIADDAEGPCGQAHDAWLRMKAWKPQSAQ